MAAWFWRWRAAFRWRKRHSQGACLKPLRPRPRNPASLPANVRSRLVACTRLPVTGDRKVSGSRKRPRSRQLHPNHHSGSAHHVPSGSAIAGPQIPNTSAGQFHSASQIRSRLARVVQPEPEAGRIPPKRRGCVCPDGKRSRYPSVSFMKVSPGSETSRMQK